MFNFFRRTQIHGEIFNGHFVDAKALYVAKFNDVPCVTFIGELNVTKAFDYIMQTYNRDINATYQHSYFNHDDKEVYFNNTIVVLNFKRVIEIANDYCQVLHNDKHYAWVSQLVTDLAQFRIEKDTAPAYRHIHVVGFAKETAMN